MGKELVFYERGMAALRYGALGRSLRRTYGQLTAALPEIASPRPPCRCG